MALRTILSITKSTGFIPTVSPLLTKGDRGILKSTSLEAGIGPENN